MKKIYMLLLIMWNLKSALTCKCMRVVITHTSLYFAISTIIFHILFMYHALYFLMFIFTWYSPCFSFFSINLNRKQALWIKWFVFVFVEGQSSDSYTHKLQQLKRKNYITWVLRLYALNSKVTLHFSAKLQVEDLHFLYKYF